MKKIIYTPITKNDYPAIKSLINEAFEFYKFIEDEKFLDRCLTIYLRMCLAETTFSSIAKKDGKVIGVILGNAKGKVSRLSTLKHITHTVYHLIPLMFSKKSSKAMLNQYSKVLKTYDEFLAPRKTSFQGSIELFIVSKESRGLGIGKKLVHQLIDYMKFNHISNIYLFTDDRCNYGFYDNFGFNRLASKPIEMSFSSSVSTLNVFLYGISL